MSDVFGLLWLLLLLLTLTLGLAVAIAALAAVRTLRSTLLPSVRLQRAWFIAALPWLSPLTMLVAVCALALAKPLGWIADHCLHHGVGHPHLCFAHLPALDIGYLEAAVTVALAVLLVVPLARLLRREWTIAQRLSALRALASASRPVRIVDDRQPLAFAGGVRRPFILLSRGLLQQLSPHERRIVLAHEVAHVRHGDLHQSLLFEVLLLIHPAWLARRLKAVRNQAQEERADDRVVQRFGPQAVAATLLRAMRIVNGQPQPSLSVMGADPIRRVRRLLSGVGESQGRQDVFHSCYFGGLAITAVLVIAAHHELESLLGLLTGI